MKNKLAKSMSMIIAIAMLISMVPAVVSATETDTASVDITNVTIGEPDNDGFVTVEVEYTATGLEEYTLLVVRSTNPYETEVNGDDDLTSGNLPTDDGELEKAIEYIDQEAVSADKITFKLRERTGDLVMEGAPYINVLMGGSAASAKVYTAQQLGTAPTITIPTNTTVFSDEDIVFGVTGGDATWAGAAVVKVNGADTATTANVTANSITLKSNVNVTSLKVEADGYYDATWAGTVTVKDRMEEAEKIAKAAASVSPVYGTAENDINEGDAQITIPADVDEEPTTGVSIEYTLKKGEETLTPDEDGGLVYTVARPEQGQPDATDYAVAYVISYPDITDVVGSKAITVNAIGNDGPAFTANDITLIENELLGGVYGKENMAVIIVDNANANFATAAERLVIKKADGTEYNLYYVKARNWFVGLIPVYDDADMDAKKALAQPEIKNVAYPEGKDADDYMVYYGNVAGAPVDSASGMPLYDTNDTNAIKKIFKGTTFDDSVYLAADFANGKMDGNINTNETNELKKYFKNVYIEVDGEMVPNDLAINKVSVGE